MKYVLICLLLHIVATHFVLAQYESPNSTALPICAREDDDGLYRTFIENILTWDNMASSRQEAGLTGTSLSDIVHLKEPNDNSICTTLNNYQQIDYTKKNEHNIRIYNLVHYKIRDYYLTLITYNNYDCTELDESQCNNNRSLILGHDIVEIRDLNFNKIARWSF